MKKQKTTDVLFWEKILQENFACWAKALLSGDPQKVADLYEYEDYAPGESLVFLPTMSGEIVQNRAGVEKYFIHFLAKKPTGKIVREGLQILGDRAFSHGGHYDFEVEGKNGKETLKARHTFIWRKSNRDGIWRIIQHHSSFVPIAK